MISKTEKDFQFVFFFLQNVFFIFEIFSFCFGGIFSSKKGREVDITRTFPKLLTGKWVKCSGKKLTFVSDNTKKPNGWCSFFERLGNNFADAWKEWLQKWWKNLRDS